MDRKEANRLEIARKDEGQVGKTWKQKSKRKKATAAAIAATTKLWENLP